MITESGTSGLGWCTWYSGIRVSPSRRALPAHRCRPTGGEGAPRESFAAAAALPPLPDDRGEGRDREQLAGDDDLAAFVAERRPEDPLAAAEAVDLRRVEERDAELPGPTDNVDGGAVGVGVPVAPFLGTELPGAQADAADRAEPVDVEMIHGISVRARPGRRRSRAGGSRRSPVPPALRAPWPGSSARASPPPRPRSRRRNRREPARTPRGRARRTRPRGPTPPWGPDRG